VAGLPVREQLERRPPGRPASAVAERVAGGGRLGPRLQTRAGGRPLRRRSGHGPPGPRRAALLPRREGRSAAPRGPLAMLDKDVTQTYHSKNQTLRGEASIRGGFH